MFGLPLQRLFKKCIGVHIGDLGFRAKGLISWFRVWGLKPPKKWARCRPQKKDSIVRLFWESPFRYSSPLRGHLLSEGVYLKDQASGLLHRQARVNRRSV